MKLLSLILLGLINLILLSNVNASETNIFRYPFYFGMTGGYGSTTWGGLVPSRKNQNLAVSISTPKYVTEGGILWGAFAGYELLPYFALEAAYQRYPNAKVQFDPMSIFSFEHRNMTEFTTHTESYSFMLKVMFIIPCTFFRAYSSVGVAEVHRYDRINNHWRLSPTFGVGVNYNLNEHVMTEAGANYTAGYGESELSPANDYFPFLYSFFLRLGYRF